MEKPIKIIVNEDTGDYQLMIIHENGISGISITEIQYKSIKEHIREGVEAVSLHERSGLNIPDVGRSTVGLDVIAHLIANEGGMCYCWEDIKNRLIRGEKMPFKLTDK